MATIIQTAEKTFTANNGRGTTMTLSWSDAGEYWQVMSDNASVRAWRTLGVKIYRSLEEVEAAYKTWRGIVALASDSSASVH